MDTPRDGWRYRRDAPAPGSGPHRTEAFSRCFLAGRSLERAGYGGARSGGTPEARVGLQPGDRATRKKAGLVSIEREAAGRGSAQARSAPPAGARRGEASADDRVEIGAQERRKTNDA